MPIDSGGNASDNRTDEQKKVDTKILAASASDTSSGGSKTEKQKKADAAYEKAIKENPDAHFTGSADLLGVIQGKNLKESGYNQKVKDAYLAKQAADMEARNMRADGTQKDDDKPVKKAALATTTEEEETEEETTDEQTAVEKATDELVAAADATASSSTASTPATQAAAASKKKGQKSGTIATSPQGISVDDDTGLRPFRGLLADETKKKKTLIA